MNLWQAWKVRRGMARADREKRLAQSRAIHPVWWVRLWMVSQSGLFRVMMVLVVAGVVGMLGAVAALYIEPWAIGNLVVFAAIELSGVVSFAVGMSGVRRAFMLDHVSAFTVKRISARYETMRQFHEAPQAGEITHVEGASSGDLTPVDEVRS